MGQIVVVGLDIAKPVFQVHGVDRDGGVVVRRRLRRSRVLLRWRRDGVDVGRAWFSGAWLQGHVPAAAPDIPCGFCTARSPFSSKSIGPSTVSNWCPRSDAIIASRSSEPAVSAACAYA
jgi:hypothetical protein